MAENSSPKGDAPEGDRIAKVLSRRGVSSRREAERLIEAGEVKVNGKTITSPALNVTDRDVITISGHPLPALEPARLWLYYKPEGLVTSEADEKGRDTVFDHLPEDMPRVMSVGRLDLNSEGLLLLTNDGELKRRLELPSTGWLRKYRVRVNGNPTDPDLEPLRKGITIEGEKFQPMVVILDRIQGANAWLTVGIREGKNREIRRAMNAINLTVNRLIRISYGPFRLEDLQPGQVEEVRAKVLRDQLGEGRTDDGTEPAARKPRPTATKRVRPGDGIRALAKAWDDATTPARKADETQTRRAPATAKDSARRSPAARDDAPRPAKPRSPRPSDREEDRSAGPRRTAAASRSIDDAPTRRVSHSSRSTDRDDDRAAKPRSARPTSARRSDDTPTRRAVPSSRTGRDADRTTKPRVSGNDDAPTRRVTHSSRVTDRDEDRPSSPRRFATAKTADRATDKPTAATARRKPASPSAPREAASGSRKPAGSGTGAAPRTISGPRKGPTKPSGKPTGPRKPR